MNNGNIVALIISFVIGTLYYINMYASIPTGANCSFIANIWTDIIAFIMGFILVYKGFQQDDNILLFIGGALITEHIWQVVFNKVY